METQEPQQEQAIKQQQEQEQGAKKRQGWFWIPVSRESKCEGCAKELRPPEKVAYGYYSRQKVFCPECAQKEGVAAECQPSRKLLRLEKKMATAAAAAAGTPESTVPMTTLEGTAPAPTPESEAPAATPESASPAVSTTPEPVPAPAA